VNEVISVIIPTYNEEDNLMALYERLVAVAEKIEDSSFEFLFVDDCSADKTSSIIENLRKNDPRIKVIRFSRNCGSYNAVAAGLHFCKGEAAVMLAADLQDPPELILRLLPEWKKGYKVVWAAREKRLNESLFVLLTSRLFYFLMNKLTDISQSAKGADVFLIDRAVIEAFRNSPEKNTSVTMLISWLGYPQTSITYIKEGRHAGVSKWNMSRRFKYFFDSLISFSYAPLRLMSLMGVIAAFVGLLYALYVFQYALRGASVEGWSSLMIVILLLGGFQMIMMGMLGEYLWRTYDETRGRPRYVIEKNSLLDTEPNLRK
jgi:glycosyltransferase involved in cell wall biosynthesis